MQRAVIASLVALLTAPAYGQATGKPVNADQSAGVFRSGVDLVTVSATVRDKRGRAVRDLTVADFEVLDRGVPRRISEFRTEAAPVSVAILFDVSGSMDVASRSLAAKFAANHVLSWLEHGRDEAALFAFDSRLHEVAPFTVDTRALQGALGEVEPFGATSLHDAIAETARTIHERANSRRAIIVLTDGIGGHDSRACGVDGRRAVLCQHAVGHEQGGQAGGARAASAVSDRVRTWRGGRLAPD
jgi:VWFA-related protein